MAWPRSEIGRNPPNAAELAQRSSDATTRLLTETMGLEPADERRNRRRFAASGGVVGTRVDVLHTPETGFGQIAAGTVHHVAWRVPDEAAQARWREALASVGLQATEILDRQYFKSIYFREPGGVLFELATDPPGFTRDEEPAELGCRLQLPPWLEPRRERIEQALPAVTAPPGSGCKRCWVLVKNGSSKLSRPGMSSERLKM